MLTSNYKSCLGPIPPTELTTRTAFTIEVSYQHAQKLGVTCEYPSEVKNVHSTWKGPTQVLERCLVYYISPNSNVNYGTRDGLKSREPSNDKN